ncbi:CGNR zinc finger domain-containing protein [Amycolatopsis jejuensis]|uniref:CGNR zinc finger domain-containing protein n=1 Tax=Amycolatopsis jejuensis TaxID=330084 RepID=UPI0005255DAE|nr:CGNR zinc finger domain-containing protein [Amycolatopsis jejuensis]
MHFNPYGGAGAQVAADLATLSQRDGATADDVLAVGRAHGMALPRIDHAQAERILAWGRQVHRVFTATTLAERVDLVNHLLEVSACRPHISRHNGKTPHLHYSCSGAEVVERFSAYTAGGLAHVVCEDSDRLGVCAREGCDVAFVDTSRNGRRRFCSTRCGTRVNVADHRARQLTA